MTQALILAAGIGNRLGDAAGDRPKSLLEFDGVSLLQRHIRILNGVGINRISVVTGHRSEMIESTLQALAHETGPVNTIYNKDYLEGSVVSLWTGREVLESSDSVLLMDADVLYSENILKMLVSSRQPNCLLIDREFEPGDEPVKVCIRDEQIIEFRKKIDPQLKFDMQGESVGFFKFNAGACNLILDKTHSYVSNGRRDQPYEEVLRDVLHEHPDLFGFEDITGHAWIEIDFPEDIERARTDILARI
ncbi:MAG: phosphocholine cytidylyltransferase family protein [Thiotrichales bacterium]|nr:phosphocholine cytidylyltransferase family protein [Thiotrichales bacterium]